MRLDVDSLSRTALCICLFVAILFPAAARAGALGDYFARLAKSPLAPAIDTRGTFRDLSFGATCSTVPGFTMVKDVGHFRSFRRADDKLSIGTGSVEAIRYVCVGDVFRAVFIMFPEGSLSAVATAMVGTYGAPSSDESKMAYWRGLKRVAWLGRTEAKGDYLMTIGDLPWADPLGLLLLVTSANAQAGQTDL